MSTAFQSSAEQRFLLHDVPWPTYELFLREFGSRPIRLTYDRGDLEMMSPSGPHERSKYLIGRLIDVWTEELNIAVCGLGSTTWRKQYLKRGLEPDTCYYIQNEARVRGKAIDLDVDPPPDLAVEIEVSRS